MQHLGNGEGVSKATGNGVMGIYSGYRTAQGDFDPEEPMEDWDEEHPTNCICPECKELNWWMQYEDRIDPLDDENWEPPF